MQLEKKNKRNTILIASFIPKEMLSWFLSYLEEKFMINNRDVFVYEIEDDETEFIVTFKVEKYNRVDLRYHFIKAAVVNMKSGCIFSINGLNKLIEEKTGAEKGNISHKDYRIDWNEYSNKLILCNKSCLIIKTIKKIEDITDKK